MEKDNVGVKLKEAIDHYGSIQKATENLELKNKALEEENQWLEQKSNKASLRLKRLDKKYVAQKKRIDSLDAKVKKFERQYRLFESFLAMLITSPSVDTSLKTVIALLQELTDSGWALSATPDQMRDLFVSNIMGYHLKSFRCKGCGAKFITNIGPKGTHSGFYICPSCYNSYHVGPDNSFLEAMVSEKQLDDIFTAAKLKEENDILKPLKPFLEIPCKICGKPITVWDEHNIKIAKEIGLWGHTDCWNSEPGKLLLLIKSCKNLESDWT